MAVSGSRLKAVVTALLLFVALGAAPPAVAQDLVAGVDTRVELLTIVFRLAGNPEYNQCRVPAYSRAIDEWFAPFRDHPAVRQARTARQRSNVSFDAVMSYAIHISDAGDPRERVPFDEPGNSLEGRWRGATEGRPFLDSLRAFVRDARTSEFFASQQALFDTANARLQRVLQQEVDLAWFARFFGRQSDEAFHLVPGLCNGGGSYGPSFRPQAGRGELYAIIGISQAESAGGPRIGAGLGPVVVHEFNHSFVNPVLNARAADFSAAGPEVLRPVAAAMRTQAYSSWNTVLNESVVRAAAARYMLEHRGDSAARAEIGREHGRSFLWTGELYLLLGHYEAHRDSFPTLASFVPSLAAWWAGLAPRVAGMVTEYDARRPLFVGMEPADRAGVDPATTVLRFRFDRPMAGGYSLNFGPGGRATFPRVQGQAWDSSRTVFELRVQLEPGRNYELNLNNPYGGGFQSADGIASREIRVAFRTR